jgi:hypothetical protein
VIAVGDVAATNRARCEVVTEKARDQQYEPEPGSGLFRQRLLTSTTGLGRRGLWLDLRRLYVRRCSSGAAVGRHRVRSLRLLRRKIRDVSFPFVFHSILRFTYPVQSRLREASAINPVSNSTWRFSYQLPGITANHS